MGSEGGGESYMQRNNPAFDAVMTTRTARHEAAFLLPHLTPGMRVLDVGCGPGSIAVGLGELVESGRVVGVDVRADVMEAGRALAASRGISNIEFQTGSVYDLPFPDASFDAAIAHIVLMHLSDPVGALREVRRVLKPAGIVGVRDPDFGAVLHFPSGELGDRWAELRNRVHRHNGGHPFLGRSHRRLLLQAGFAEAEAGASVMVAGSRSAIETHVEFLKAQLLGVAQTALELGWTDKATVEAVLAELDEWAERPDAFAATVMCHAVAWVSRRADESQTGTIPTAAVRGLGRAP